MAGTLTHVFVSTHTEAGSSIGLVSANEWNSSHALSGTWDSSQITSLNSSQISGLVLSSQISTLGSSQLTGSILSSQIATVGSSQLTGTVLSSQIATITSSQISTQLLSSQIASLGSSQLTGTLPSSQGGTGATTLGTPGNLIYSSSTGSSAVAGVGGSAFDNTTQTLTLTSFSIKLNGMVVQTAAALELHAGTGGL